MQNDEEFSEAQCFFWRYLCDLKWLTMSHIRTVGSNN